MLSNKPILVLGMHRSGTSCLAGSLHESGVYFGDVSLANQYNKKGNRENNAIMLINDSILEHSHGSWSDPPKKIKWTAEHEKQGVKIINNFEENSDSNSWGFKDPRTLLTFPFWQKLLSSYKLVGTIRSPISVANSLKTRDQSFTISKGLDLWLKYNQSLLNIIKITPFPLISFDLPAHEYQFKLNSIKSELNLLNTSSETFFEKNLRSQNEEKHYKYNNEIQSCFSALEELLH